MNWPRTWLNSLRRGNKDFIYHTLFLVRHCIGGAVFFMDKVVKEK